MGLLFFFLEDDRYESGKKERTIGCGVWSRVALLLTRGGATSIYTVGRTEKKPTKERERERKKKEKTTSRERDIHTLTLSAFSFCFSNITSTRKHTRARLPLPPKPKPKKQVTSPLSTRI